MAPGEGQWPRAGLAGEGSCNSPAPLSPRLYKYVNEELFSKPTYASFIKLLDNYQRATGTEEEVTAEELREQDRFLEEVMKTELMRKLFAFLQGKSESGAGQGRGTGESQRESRIPEGWEWGRDGEPPLCLCRCSHLFLQTATAPSRSSCRI